LPTQAKSYVITEICDREIFGAMKPEQQLARIQEVQDIIDIIQASKLSIQEYEYKQPQPISRFLIL